MMDLFYIRDKQKRRIKLISTVQTNVAGLGLALHLDYPVIQSIEQRNHYQEQSCREILDYWLKGNGHTPINWETLLDALRDYEFIRFADELELALTDQES